MKKILTVIVCACLALAGIYAGAGYWMGVQVGRQHDRLIETINKSTYLKASVKSYERGIFSSRVLVTLTVARPKVEKSISFGIVDTVYHGPFAFFKNRHIAGPRPVLATIRTQLAPDDSSDEFKKIVEKAPEIGSSEALTIISIDGSGVSYFDIPSFQRKFPGENSEVFDVNWGGFSAQSHFDPRLEQISGSFEGPFLQIVESGNLQFRMKDLLGSFDSRPGVKGVYVGSSSFSVASIEGIEKDNTVFNLIALGGKMESGVTGETIDGSLRLGFDKLDAGGMSMGPSTMEFDGRKLDAEILARFQKLLPELQKKAVAEKTDGADEARDKLTALIGELISKSPEFEMKQLEVKTDKGDLKGKARLTFTGPGLNFAGNILGLIASIEANAEFSVSEALFLFIAQNAYSKGSGANLEEAKNSVDELVKGLIAANILLREGDSFKSSAAYKHGIVTVNGRKLDLSKLKQ